MFRSKQWLLFLALVSLLNLRGLVAGPLQELESGESSMAAPVDLLYLPFQAPGGALKEPGQEAFDAWVLGALAEVQERFAFITVQRLPRGEEPPSLESNLQSIRGSRQAREHLEPVYSRRKAEGALVFWLERQGKGRFRMVSLLYLPGRLSVMTERVSLNLEHILVPLSPEGKFSAPEAKAAATTLLERSFQRIVDVESKLDGGDSTPSLVPSSVAPTDPVGDERVAPSAPDLSPGEEPEASLDDVASPEPPLRLGVIELSWDLIQPLAELQSSFSEDALDFRLLQPKTLRALESVEEIQRVTSLEIEPWTYDELEAPTLNLDPKADPKAKEKLLAEQAGDLDGLIFGHLRQSKGEGGIFKLDLYLRLFLKDTLQVFTANSKWLQAKDSKILRGIVKDATKQALVEAFGEQQPENEPIWIFPKSGEGLESIVRRCYGSFPDRQTRKLAEKLATANSIKDPGQIARDRKIRIPSKLGGTSRKSPSCRSGRS